MLAEKYHIRMPYHDLAASRKMQAGSDGCKTDFFGVTLLLFTSQAVVKKLPVGALLMG